MITLDQLRQIMPSLNAEDGLDWASVLNTSMWRFEIKSRERESAFLAQVAHESAELTHTEENLNYSADGLVKTWPGKFWVMSEAEPEKPIGKRDALNYARRPQITASYVYAGRMGNGEEPTSDGWRFRGRGPIQITGRSAYRACSIALCMDPDVLQNEPELLLEPGYGAASAAWFWQSNGCNELADRGEFQRITRVINGGLNGYESRVAYHVRAMEALNVIPR